jgi:hypothetical protein
MLRVDRPPHNPRTRRKTKDGIGNSTPQNRNIVRNDLHFGRTNPNFVFLVNDMSKGASGRRRKPWRALELAGIEFIDENGGGPGLRLRKHPRAKPSKR